MRWLRRLFRLGPPDAEAVIHHAYNSMPPDVVQQVVSTIGGFVADRHGRPSRESDLPIPKTIIELAFIKALREWPEGPQLEALKTLHVTLDSHFLTNEECKLITRWDDLASSGPKILADIDPSRSEVEALLKTLADEQSKEAAELHMRLAEKARARLQLNRRLRGEPRGSQ